MADDILDTPCLSPEHVEAVQRAYWSIMENTDRGALYRLRQILKAHGLSTTVKPASYPPVITEDWYN